MSCSGRLTFHGGFDLEERLNLLSGFGVRWESSPAEEANIGSVYSSKNDQSEANGVKVKSFNWPNMEKQVAYWRRIADAVYWLNRRSNIYPTKIIFSRGRCTAVALPVHFISRSQLCVTGQKIEKRDFEGSLLINRILPRTNEPRRAHASARRATMLEQSKRANGRAGPENPDLYIRRQTTKAVQSGSIFHSSRNEETPMIRWSYKRAKSSSGH